MAQRFLGFIVCIGVGLSNGSLQFEDCRYGYNHAGFAIVRTCRFRYDEATLWQKTFHENRSMIIDSKLPDVGVTIFTIMSKLAAEHSAINLSQGFPEFHVDPILVSLVEKFMNQHKNQYAPMQGVESLRQKIAEKTWELYSAKINPDEEVTITSGATEALFAAITAVIKPGDEVILFEPAYDSYEPVIKLNGGVPVFVQLKFPDYRIDWNEVQKAVSKKTRMIILNSPHNPSGTILRDEDLRTLIEVVQDSRVIITSDEVYEHIVFDDRRHESILRYPQLAARSFVVSSFGKSFHTTGWKIGYCIAPPALTKEFQRIHQYLTFASNTPIQFAYAEYLNNKKAYLDLPLFYQEKRDRFLKQIEGSRFKALPCAGTYFQLLDYSKISDQPDTEFAKWMTIAKKVASIPTSVFYHKKNDYKVLRFCFAKNDDTLFKAGEILKTI